MQMLRPFRIGPGAVVTATGQRRRQAQALRRHGQRGDGGGSRRLSGMRVRYFNVEGQTWDR
ncbi:hypothetical protein N234_08355 [Ralstonia pickettii DTP0602]|nr:hypothetical protein N234_08355 [Ralstonia pickettii DTP0602]